MQVEQGFWHFVTQQWQKLLDQTLAHVGLTTVSVLLAVVIGVPVGIYIARRQRFAPVVLGIAGVLQTIPSMALLGFMIPLLGIGARPAIAVLFLYGLLPIIRNTYTGISGVSPSVTDAARGMGMSPRQVLVKVQLPLAMPVIFAGIRTTTVIGVGVATLAAYIAAGGLGEFIFGGIALNNTNMILAGAIPAALLAILFDFLLSRLQHMKRGKLRKISWALPLGMLLLSSFYLLPAASGRILAGFEAEFMGRRDGYLGLKSKYKLDIPTVVISDAMMYKAVYEEKLDVISGYSTDGRLKAFDLVALEDDKGIFPPYYAAPLVRQEVLKQHPQLGDVLNKIAGQISDSLMTELNYRVDHLKQSPKQVAKEFLQSKKIWRPPQGGGGGLVRIGSKIFGEQYILAEMYSMLIRGYTNLDVETKTGLGGTKICFDALTNGQIDLYPEYTGTGLLVILQSTPAVIDSLGGSADRVYQFVRDAFQRRYNLTWLSPIGFNNTYALMMRREHATFLQVKTISDLKAHLDLK